MWNFASSCVAGCAGLKSSSPKPSHTATECSDDEVSSDGREEVLECPICWESFNIVENVPHVLWCGHTLCKNCILGLQWAVVKFPTLPVQLPLFISCPWCNLLSFRLVYKGNLKFPCKNYFLLWMVENMNVERVKSHSSFSGDQLVFPVSGNSSRGNQISHSNLRRGHHVRQLDPQGPNNANSHVHSFNLERLQSSLRKLLVFFVHLTAKFPLVIIFLLIILYAVPASAAILALYVLVTVLFALPSFLILYFAYPRFCERSATASPPFLNCSATFFFFLSFSRRRRRREGGGRRMESTESSYVSSPEAPAKRSPPPPKSPNSDNMEKATYIRFLVSNAAAGSVIGKGGSTINDFQSQSGARIQLSRNHEFFPGTTDRIIMVSGTINEILKAMELVLSKLLSELHAEEGDDVEPRTKVRLIVPHSSCGAIIGKGGSTIKSFIEDSQAGIKISPQDNNYMGSTDRLVTLSGTIEEQMRATDLIVSKLSEDPHYTQSMNYPFSYPTSYNAVNYGSNGGAGGRFQNNKEERSNSLTIGVSDGHIGLVVGRGGRNILEISQASGARIKISDRGDFMSGTTDRKVTITGSQRAIRTAESMIMQKVAYASERVLAQ